ncbi:MAG: hypothetical protein JWM28_59, partial [Chitinophagaceae bacterium]|nr:hypothetical protein [Chitinophagaceae bacterium]
MKDWAILTFLFFACGFKFPPPDNRKTILPAPVTDYKPDNNSIESITREDTLQYDGPYV